MRHIKNTFDTGFFGTVPDILFLHLAGEQGFNGIDHQRLPGASLAGYYI